MWPPSFPAKANRGENQNEDADKVFRVAEVNKLVRYFLEKQWGGIWIEGEVSNATKAASGHMYFTLNDEQSPAQIQAVMFRGDLSRAKVSIENGNRVRLFGSLSLYEARGGFQLIAKKALVAGEGDLAAEFERIKNKLQAEGLFDSDRKRPLPFLPQTIGVVTSAHGAALYDIVQVVEERFPSHIVVADCRVQGSDAPSTIIRALTSIQKLPELDVVIIARGGGSAEDLWAFNDENVARAIASCRVPTMSAVGHEVDFTISDFVADVRAATPSNAGELVVPERKTLVQRLGDRKLRLERAMDQYLEMQKSALSHVRALLQDPQLILLKHRNQLQQLSFSLARLGRDHIHQQKAVLHIFDRRLEKQHPHTMIAKQKFYLSDIKHRFEVYLNQKLTQERHQLDSMQHSLRNIGQKQLYQPYRNRLTQALLRMDSMSPLKVLSRGYAIALHAKSGEAITEAHKVRKGDAVLVRLHQGSLDMQVEKVHP